MLNLGPQSKRWLAKEGVHELLDLQSQDAVALYLRVKQSQPTASINLLYALVGAQQGLHWREVAQSQKTELLTRLEALSELMQSVLVSTDPVPSKNHQTRAKRPSARR